MIGWVRGLVLGVGVTVGVGVALTGTASRTAVAVAQHHTPVHRTFPVGHGNNVYAYWNRGAHDVAWIINVHGGYWHGGAGGRRDLLAWAAHEQHRGLAAFSIDYRLVPHVQWPTPEQDVEAAIAWIRAHARVFGLDPARGFIQGDSAGGLLASVAALDEGGFAGVITMAGAVDPYDEYRHDPNAKLRRAALALHGGRPPQADPTGWQSARAVTHLGLHRLPFLVVQSAHDHTVNVRTGRRFAAALRAAGYPVDLDVRPGDSHVLGGPGPLTTADTWMADVLAGHPPTS